MAQGSRSNAGRLAPSPLGRLVVLAGIGLLLFLSMLLLALQPASGWSWAASDWRSMASVDSAIWSALVTGLLAWLASAWVWTLKPCSPAAALFAASGAATLVFCFSSFQHLLALPLSEGIASWFWIVNMLGASAFGIAMICLFLIYPSRLAHWRALAAATVLGFGAWTLSRTFGPWRDFAAVQRITTLEMLGIMLAVGWQLRASAGDLRQLAIARWLGASVLVGAGAFIATVALPLSLGFSPLIREHHAFAFFLIIDAGLVVGLMRYRLFDLGAWACWLVFHAFAILLLIALDMFLIAALSLGRPQAFGISLALVGFAYLPLRERLWRWFTAGDPKDGELLFQRVMEAAFKRSGDERAQAWRRLLDTHFRPLQLVEEAVATPVPLVAEEGLALLVPGALDSPAIRLRYGNRGRSLFGMRDADVAAQLLRLAEQAQESREAYDRGVAEERVRIARDLHDNIGAQLMRALHSGLAPKKDAMIRDTLADLRDVINHAHGRELSLDEMLADLRAETADRLDPHGVALDWAMQADAGLMLTPASAHALRSVVREAASNTIKHARASRLGIDAAVAQGWVRLGIEDDGDGFDIETVGHGHGLSNMAARVEGVGGSFAVQRGAVGARLTASFPLQVVRP